MKRSIILAAGWLMCLMVNFCMGAEQAEPVKDRSHLLLKTQNFNDSWRFINQDVKEGWRVDLDDSSWRQVNVPHDWSIEGPYDSKWASSTGYLPGGIGWYRRSFNLGPEFADKIIRIKFEGVYKNSEVWINGYYLGKRPNGYVPFMYELTGHLNFDKPNILTVRVDHSDFADSRWYTGSGIYRPVSLLVDNKVHIEPDGIYITTPEVTPKQAWIRVEINLVNQDNKDYNIDLYHTSWNKEINNANYSDTIKAGERKSLIYEFTINNPLLWKVDLPILSGHKVVIRHDNKIMDYQTIQYGIRYFRFDPNEGFLLNEEKIKIKGVCVHHDGGPLGAVVPEMFWYDRLQKLKDIGCNAIRMSHNPPSTELLDLCDQMGFLVMDEAFDEFTPPKRKWVEGWNVGTPSYDGYGRDFEKWCIEDIQAMVKRDRNHPSIILWSIGNEIDYANDPFSHPSMGAEYKPDQPPAENLVKYGKPLVEAVRALDKTRPITAAMANSRVSNIVGYGDLLDVAGYNYQEQYYLEDHKKYPNRCILGSENSRNYEAWKAVVDNDFVAGQFLWLGFDFLGESMPWPNKNSQSGLFDLCGFYKPGAWFRKSLWTDEPMVYICTRPAGRQGGRRSSPQEHWNWQAGQEVTIECYTNCAQAELFLNGKSLGIKNSEQKQSGVLTWQVAWEAGELKATGTNNGKTCDYQLRTAGPAKRIKIVALECGEKYYTHTNFSISLVDENEVVVPDAQNYIQISTIRGKLIAVGTANPQSHENHQASYLQLWHGRGMVVVRNEPPSFMNVPAYAHIKVESEGFEPVEKFVER